MDPKVEHAGEPRAGKLEAKAVPSPAVPKVCSAGLVLLVGGKGRLRSVRNPCLCTRRKKSCFLAMRATAAPWVLIATSPHMCDPGLSCAPRAMRLSRYYPATTKAP